MAAAESRRAVMFAASAGPMAALFTAHPERVERLILYGSMARFTRAPDYPHRLSLDRLLAVVAQTWGTPGVRADVRAEPRRRRRRVVRGHRAPSGLSASPSGIRRASIRSPTTQQRSTCARSCRRIRRPTLIVHRREDRTVACANGRFLADRVPGAVYLELPGADHVACEGDFDAIVDAGSRASLPPSRCARRRSTSIAGCRRCSSSTRSARPSRRAHRRPGLIALQERFQGLAREHRRAAARPRRRHRRRRPVRDLRRAGVRDPLRRHGWRARLQSGRRRRHARRAAHRRGRADRRRQGRRPGRGRIRRARDGQRRRRRDLGDRPRVRRPRCTDRASPSSRRAARSRSGVRAGERALWQARRTPGRLFTLHGRAGIAWGRRVRRRRPRAPACTPAR